MEFLLLGGVWLALMNGLAYRAFRLDKERARAGVWRVPEGTLLALAFLGGWPAAKLAQRRFRHKTRKEPFRSLLNICAIGPLLVAMAAATAWSGAGTVANVLAGLSFQSGPAPTTEASGRSVTINRGGVRETVTFGD